MTVTTEARGALNAHIEPHKGQERARKTPTGLLKTKEGLIIQPTSFTGEALHSGAIDELTDEEKGFFQLDEEEEARPQLRLSKPTETTTQPARRKKKAKAGDTDDSRDVIIEIGVGGLGTIRSQCRHCYVGRNGVVVMGLGPLSYRPRAAEMDGEEAVLNAMTLSTAPGKYFFIGEEFKDKDGITNIILHKIPEEAPEEDEEYDNEEDQQ